MENKIIFVVREGLVVRNISGQYTTFNGVGSVVALLNGLKETLATIPTNAQGLAADFTTIYLPDTMNGLLSNSIGLYLRNGKTASGKVIDEAELNLYVEVYNLLTERNFNVRLYNLKHVSKDDAVTRTLIKNTWAVLDREERKLLMSARAGVGIGAAQPAINAGQPTPEMIAMQQQMAMMQQMMQQMMMMNGQAMQGQMPMMNMQMPVAPVQPVAQETITPDLGAPTALNVDLGQTPVVNNVTPDATAPAVEEYEPEF